MAVFYGQVLALLLTLTLGVFAPAPSQAADRAGPYAIIHIAWLDLERQMPLFSTSCKSRPGRGEFGLPAYAGVIVVPHIGDVVAMPASPLFEGYLKVFEEAWNNWPKPGRLRTGDEPQSVADAFAMDGCWDCKRRKRIAERASPRKYQTRADPDFLPTLIDSLMFDGFTIVRFSTNMTGKVSWAPIIGKVERWNCLRGMLGPAEWNSDE